jgi:hypothetical protein
MRYLSLIAIALLVSCAPGRALTGGATPSATQVAVLPSPSAAATAAPHAYREVTALDDFMLPSPDGQTVWSFVQGPKGTVSYFVFQQLDGTVIGRIDNPTAMGRPEWLPDSSAVFIELAAGQRAGPLGVLRSDGRLTETGLDDSSPALSPDGTWIATERQEGCCVGIRIHEIRIAPRAGGPTRTFVTSSDPAPQPVDLLGWTLGGEVIYRDGTHIRSVTLDGRISDLPLIAPASARDRMPTRSGVSPDQRLILACAADPLAFWVVAGGTVADLPLGLQPAWSLRVPWCSRPDEVNWLGRHELLLRDATGRLRAFDATNGAIRALAIPAGSILVSASDDVLLVSIDGDRHVMSASAGSDHAVGLRFGSEFSVRPLEGGRFFMFSGRSGYVIGWVRLTRARACPSRPDRASAPWAQPDGTRPRRGTPSTRRSRPASPPFDTGAGPSRRAHRDPSAAAAGPDRPRASRRPAGQPE